MSQSWEYRVEDLPTKNMSNAQVMAERSGWELVALQDDRVWGVYAFLKRPKQS